MNQNPFMAHQFGTQFVPGVGYVEAGPAAPVGALGDDSSVMMISGLGAAAEDQQFFAPASAAIQKWWNAVPWWVWVLVAIGALSAGAYLFRNLKKAAR